jgi:hypothetical protein
MERRKFIRKASLAVGGITTLPMLTFGKEVQDNFQENNVFIIGPLKGYSPQIGTLVSMLNYNRQTIIDATKSLTQAQLDYLHDPKSNTIGALLMHLGAIEKFYQVNTFEKRDDLTDAEKKIWADGMNLGENGRKNIKGKDIKYYLDIITELREKTLAEFKKKDDAWLLESAPFGRSGRMVNTYWKWFHVCEHEANHRGQITWIKGRLPGATGSGD